MRTLLTAVVRGGRKEWFREKVMLGSHEQLARRIALVVATVICALAGCAFPEEGKVIATQGVPVQLEDWRGGVISEIANDPCRTVAWTGHKSPYFGLTRSFALAP